MKKVPGDKINLCIRNELRDTQDASAQQQQLQQQQDNNNNNGTTTTQWAQVVILLKMGNSDKLCNWGNLSLFAHIAAQCRRERREDRSEKEREGKGRGGRVCLHFLKNTLCALMAAVLRGLLLNRVFYALFYLCKIMFQLNETRAVIARNYIRATTAILCYYCCPVHATPHLPLHPLHAKGLVAHSCDAL